LHRLLLACDTYLLTEYTTRLLVRRRTGKDDYTYERPLRPIYTLQITASFVCVILNNVSPSNSVGLSACLSQSSPLRLVESLLANLPISPHYCRCTPCSWIRLSRKSWLPALFGREITIISDDYSFRPSWFAVDLHNSAGEQPGRP
jgi:hypothetical protein